MSFREIDDWGWCDCWKFYGEDVVKYLVGVIKWKFIWIVFFEDCFCIFDSGDL